MGVVQGGAAAYVVLMTVTINEEVAYAAWRHSSMASAALALGGGATALWGASILAATGWRLSQRGKRAGDAPRMQWDTRCTAWCATCAAMAALGALAGGAAALQWVWCAIALATLASAARETWTMARAPEPTPLIGRTEQKAGRQARGATSRRLAIAERYRRWTREAADACAPLDDDETVRRGRTCARWEALGATMRAEVEARIERGTREGVAQRFTQAGGGLAIHIEEARAAVAKEGAFASRAAAREIARWRARGPAALVHRDRDRGARAGAAAAVLGPALTQGAAAGTAVGTTLCACLLSTAVRAGGALKGRMG